MGTLLGPKYIPYSYMDPLGQQRYTTWPLRHATIRRGQTVKAQLQNKQTPTHLFWGAPAPVIYLPALVEK